MFRENEIVVYKRDVCRIKEVKNNYYNNKDYYILEPIYDSSLKIEIPIDSKLIRQLISKEEIDKLIGKIKDIDIINSQERIIENEYKNLLQSGNYEDLIKIIKTTYIRNKNREENKKKISEKDDHYFKLAEKYLYSEFSVVLGLTIDETKKYIVDNV